MKQALEFVPLLLQTLTLICLKEEKTHHGSGDGG